jgi:hypothetical protein
MTICFRAKIKDRDQFMLVFPLPVDGTSEVGRFILSVIGKTIQVRKMRSDRGSFYYVSDVDPRYVIIPNWIAFFDTEELLPTHTAFDSCLAPLILEDGTVVTMGS